MKMVRFTSQPGISPELRKRLVALGWTPPKVAKKEKPDARDTSVA